MLSLFFLFSLPKIWYSHSHKNSVFKISNVRNISAQSLVSLPLPPFCAKVPRHSTKGGEVENGRLYNLQLSQAIRTMYGEVKKTGRDDYLSLVRWFPWQLIYVSVCVFNQILLKTAKNDHFETIFQLCASPLLTFWGQLDFFDFLLISYLSNLEWQKFGWFWFVLSRVMLKKTIGGSSQSPFVQEG